VYAGFGSMPMRASKDAARVAIEAIRARGRREAGLPRLGRPGLIDAYRFVSFPE
jgi:hypothetical protein